MKLRTWCAHLLLFFSALDSSPRPVQAQPPLQVTDEGLVRFDREIKRQMYLRWHHQLVDRFNQLLNQVAFVNEVGKQSQSVRIPETIAEHMQDARRTLAASSLIGRVNAANQNQESLDRVDEELGNADDKLAYAERAWAETHRTEVTQIVQASRCATQMKRAEPLTPEDIENNITPVMKCLSAQKTSFGDGMILTYEGLVPLEKAKPKPILAKVAPAPPKNSRPLPQNSKDAAKAADQAADKAMDQAIDDKLRDKSLTSENKDALKKLNRDEKLKAQLKKLLAKSTVSVDSDAAKKLKEVAEKDIDAALKKPDKRAAGIRVESANSASPQPSGIPGSDHVGTASDKNKSDKAIAMTAESATASNFEPKRKETAERKEQKLQKLKSLEHVFRKKASAQVSQLRGRSKLIESWKTLLSEKEVQGKLSENILTEDLHWMREQLELESYDLSSVMPDPYFKDGMAAWARSLLQLKSQTQNKANWANQLLTLTDEVNAKYFNDPLSDPAARYMDLLKAPDGARRADPSQKAKLYLSLLQESGIALPDTLIPLLQKSAQGALSVVFYDKQHDKIFDPETGKSAEYWDDPLISTTQLLYYDVARAFPGQKLPPEEAMIRVKPKPAPVLADNVSDKAEPSAAPAPVQTTQVAHAAPAQPAIPDTPPDEEDKPKKSRSSLGQFFKNVGAGFGVAGKGAKIGIKVLYHSPGLVFEFFKRLGDIDLSGVDLSKIDWSKLDISKVDWSKIDVSKIDFSKMKGLKVDWSKVNFSKVDLGKLDWSQVDAPKVDWSKIDPSKVDWSKIDLEGVDFTRVNVDKLDSRKIGATDLLSRVESEKRRRAQGKVRDPDDYREDLRLRGRSVAVEPDLNFPILVYRGGIASKDRDRYCQSTTDSKCEKTIIFKVKSKEVADQLIKSRSLEQDIAIIEKAYRDQAAQVIEKIAGHWLDALRSPSTPPEDAKTLGRQLRDSSSTVDSIYDTAEIQVREIARHVGFETDYNPKGTYYQARRFTKDELSEIGNDKRYRKSYKDDGRTLALLNNRFRQLNQRGKEGFIKDPKIQELLAASRRYESLSEKDPSLFAAIYESLPTEKRTEMLVLLGQVVELNHLTIAGNPQLAETFKKSHFTKKVTAGIRPDLIVELETREKTYIENYPFQDLSDSLESFGITSVPNGSQLMFRAQFAPLLAGLIKSYRPVQAIAGQKGQAEQKKRQKVSAVQGGDLVSTEAGDPAPQLPSDQKTNSKMHRIPSVAAVRIDPIQSQTAQKRVSAQDKIMERAGEENGYEPEQIAPSTGHDWDVDLLAETYVRMANSSAVVDIPAYKQARLPFKTSAEMSNTFKAFLPEVSGYYAQMIQDGKLNANDQARLMEMLLMFYPSITSPEITPEQKRLPGIIPGTEIREDVAELLCSLVNSGRFGLRVPTPVVVPSDDGSLTTKVSTTDQIRQWAVKTAEELARGAR